MLDDDYYDIFYNVESSIQIHVQNKTAVPDVPRSACAIRQGGGLLCGTRGALTRSCSSPVASVKDVLVPENVLRLHYFINRNFVGHHIYYTTSRCYCLSQKESAQKKGTLKKSVLLKEQ